MEEKQAELRVLDDNVLLVQEELKETKSGIILSKEAVSHEVKNICYISQVGPNVKNKDLKEGVYVLIPRHTGKYVPFEDFKYALVKESDILCIIDGVERKKKEEE
jgi:co-chaperonin GroES (HSP10)